MSTNLSRIIYCRLKLVIKCISLIIVVQQLRPTIFKNYEQLGDLIHAGGSLTSLRKSLVQLLRMIATIADIQALYGLIELM